MERTGLTHGVGKIFPMERPRLAHEMGKTFPLRFARTALSTAIGPRPQQERSGGKLSQFAAEGTAQKIEGKD